MKRFFPFLIIAFLFSNQLIAQTEYYSVSYLELTDMPEAVSNQAIAAFEADNGFRIASFGGIDESKAFDGIHNRCFMYLSAGNLWVPITDLPDERGRIANGASTVGNKVIVIGGYEVFQSGNEQSLADVDIFDTELLSFTTGTDIPVPIDDHVQAVYKDSLIYIVSGWSDTGNVPDVQIYDVANDSWQEGTPIPNNNLYKGFGLAGEIVGDTLYYIGGADFSFLPNQIRKGFIHPEDPTIIDWSIEENDLAQVYRPGVSTSFNKVVWFGGSYDAYNFDGLSYADNSGVVPSTDITIYNPERGVLSRLEGVLPPIMDLRGVAKISDFEYIICGGIMENQVVSNKTYRVFLELLYSNIESPTSLFPNPVQTVLNIADFDFEGRYLIRNVQGREMPLIIKPSTQVAALPVGLYMLFKDGVLLGRFIKE